MHIEKTINEKIVDENKKSVVAILRLNRTVEKGTTLYVKSPMFEEFFKSNSNDMTESIYDLEGNEVNVRRNSIPRNSGLARNFDEIGNHLVTSSGDYCTAFLRCEGISEGRTFKINGLNSKEALELFKVGASEVIGKCYNEFMKPAATSTTIQVIEDSN